jgi:hypothetical protein
MNMRFYDLIFCFLQKIIFFIRENNQSKRGHYSAWIFPHLGENSQKKTPVVTGALMGFNIPPSLLSSIFNNWSRGGGERWVKTMYLNHHY